MHSQTHNSCPQTAAAEAQKSSGEEWAQTQAFVFVPRTPPFEVMHAQWANGQKNQ